MRPDPLGSVMPASVGLLEVRETGSIWSWFWAEAEPPPCQIRRCKPVWPRSATGHQVPRLAKRLRMGELLTDGF